MNRFNDNFIKHESIRAQAHDQLVQAEVMTNFLIDLEPEELAEAGRPIPKHADQTPEELDRLETQAALAAADRLKSIRVWSEVGDNFEVEDQKATLREHKERMARYRKRRDWEAWIEEDEEDIDADRIISEIKNYKSEFFWNTSFYV